MTSLVRLGPRGLSPHRHPERHDLCREGSSIFIVATSKGATPCFARTLGCLGEARLAKAVWAGRGEFSGSFVAKAPRL